MDIVDISYYNSFASDMTNVTIHFKTLNVPVSHSYLSKLPSDEYNDYVAHDIAAKVSKMVGESVYKKIKEHLDALATEKPKGTTAQLKAGGPMNAYIWDEVSNANLSAASSWMPEVYHTSSNTTHHKALYNGTFSDTPKVSGAAIVAQLKKIFPEAFVGRHPCPACKVTEQYPSGWGLDQLIQHLNDADHQWSREQIADWLETLDVNLNAKDIDIDKEEENDD